MSPVKVLFFFALAIVAVFAEGEHKTEKRQILAVSGAVPAFRSAAFAPAPVVATHPLVLPYDDGKYFPGKYIGTGFPFESGAAFYY